MLLSLAVALVGLRQPSPVISKDLTLDSRILKGNPLGDPTVRHVAIFEPRIRSSKALPLIIYLPGYGGSSVTVLADPGMWLKLVDDLMGKGEQAVLAVVDGTDRFGCSQYVNSAATGRYLDYICDEVVPTIEKSEYCGGSAKLRIVAGHSSGGFGALRLGMARQKMFGGVVALSPDSYFDVTHKPFTTEPAVSAIKISQVEAVGKPPFEAKADSLGDDGSYVFNLCADYASNQDGSIPWIYDSKGSYREGIYDRWLEADPAVRAGRGHPFARNQRVYLDGAAQDDFKANLGAAKVAENLKGKVDNMTLYFPPGHHSDHLEERLLRGIGWIFGAPTFDIK